MKESISKAKEAVAMDVKDGKSWSELRGQGKAGVGHKDVCTLHKSPSPAILGNAYMSLFFAHDQDPELLKRSQSAYSQAVSILKVLFGTIVSMCVCEGER